MTDHFGSSEVQDKLELLDPDFDRYVQLDATMLRELAVTFDWCGAW
ncbi:hypothetical protein PC129_g1929 [Phytophthora cactorum]|uniref:Uncharacterized protein n=1 Tax=Phytophthora cactorum TaxID=29920 RepID=A0A329T193_9STRA|nr:hypothetical protein Pcac1_g20525 [Phytophthora cactorum]KAG2841407.1 hypothetical protein PC112_g3406 [Phytophthora cactorum]KAG2843197.1 hypothetical protein PC111_g2423 [Phytophthora cactorum]KAG2867999.1 hypothetical protein PC113_g1468 [Phytophthora cactorum]KAG2926625.1 hypothetical protein PC114_g3753 [Phytophthora cactorum]